MKQCIILLILIFYLQTYLFAISYEWDLLPSNTQSLLNSVTFVDENIGWIAGLSGTLLKSTDGGNTWDKKIIGYTTHFQRVQFTSNSIGWLAGQKSLQGSPATMLKTTDGGNTWSEIITGVTTIITSIAFINDNIGFITSVQGNIYKTTNSGQDWILLKNANHILNDIYTHNADTISLVVQMVFYIAHLIKEKLGIHLMLVNPTYLDE